MPKKKIIDIVFTTLSLFSANLAFAAELPGGIILGIAAFAIFLILLMSYVIFYGYFSLSRNRFKSKPKIIIFNIVNILFFGFYIFLLTEFWKEFSIAGFIFAIVPSLMQLNLSYKTTKLLWHNNSSKPTPKSGAV